MKIKCPYCKKEYNLPEERLLEFLEKKGKCGRCETIIDVGRIVKRELENELRNLSKD